MTTAVMVIDYQLHLVGNLVSNTFVPHTVRVKHEGTETDYSLASGEMLVVRVKPDAGYEEVFPFDDLNAAADGAAQEVNQRLALDSPFIPEQYAPYADRTHLATISNTDSPAMGVTRVMLRESTIVSGRVMQTVIMVRLSVRKGWIDFTPQGSIAHLFVSAGYELNVKALREQMPSLAFVMVQATDSDDPLHYGEDYDSMLLPGTHLIPMVLDTSAALEFIKAQTGNEFVLYDALGYRIPAVGP